MATKVKKKLLVVGDGAAGKTYLIHAFAHKSHSSGVEASDWGAGIANEVVDVTFEDKKVEMGLWDTPGQEDYDSLRPLAYSGTDVILIVYSIVYPDSLENILEKVTNDQLCQSASTFDCPVLLDYCKCEFERTPSFSKLISNTMP